MGHATSYVRGARAAMCCASNSQHLVAPYIAKLVCLSRLQMYARLHLPVAVLAWDHEPSWSGSGIQDTGFSSAPG